MVFISKLIDSFAVILMIKLFVCRVWPWIYRNTIGPFLFGSKIKLADYDRWAVVTGATTDLSKAYVNHLAKSGLDIVLIDGNEHQLNMLADDIKTEYGVKVQAILVDFTNGSDVYTKIADKLKQLEIGVLINNAGVPYDNVTYFHQIQNGEMMFKRLLHNNIESMTNMCYILLPKMIQRGKGIILNISSIFATAPAPLLTAYSATESYVHKFSENLALECSGTGVIVQSILPAHIDNMKKRSFFTPSTNQYVESALKTIGHGTYTYGCWPHAVLRLIFNEINFYSTSAMIWTMKTYFKKPSRQFSIDPIDGIELLKC